MTSFDVAIIGGGIIGASAAAYLAEAGRSVALFERAELAAGASGRNSGAVQHPFDPVLKVHHRRSIELYRDPRMAEAGFELSAHPAGLLLVSFDEMAVVAAASDLALTWPELAAAVLPAGAATSLEPALDPGLAACRVETGYPVAPDAATLAFAERAERAGARIHVASEARPQVEGDRVSGVVISGGDSSACEQVLIAAGPWTPALVLGWRSAPPIRSVWGVVVSVALSDAPIHILEELGIDRSGAAPDRLFSMVTADGGTSVGSTFLPSEPDATVLAAEILDRAAEFVPSVRGAALESIRSCARPVAFDGRPLIGAITGVEGLFVCAGHGPWGISTGPASAELVTRQMLGQEAEVVEMSPTRYLPPAAGNTEFA